MTVGSQADSIVVGPQTAGAAQFASTLKYDIAELVDSKYNVVAKAPKHVLAE